jgi:meiotically up-regulated gene 157 (Mug157) protein
MYGIISLRDTKSICYPISFAYLDLQSTLDIGALNENRNAELERIKRAKKLEAEQYSYSYFLKNT